MSEDIKVLQAAQTAKEILPPPPSHQSPQSFGSKQSCQSVLGLWPVQRHTAVITGCCEDTGRI